MSQVIFDFYGYIIFFYSFALILSYVALIMLAGRKLFHDVIYINETFSDILIDSSPYTPGVSIIAPAHNEELTVVENVQSLLLQDYPKFEIIIVNDGSTDNTLQRLIDTFELEQAPFFYEERLRTKPFKTLYRSRNRKYTRLVVIDKVNGGSKADAINCGLNIAQYRYFINTDIDCIIAPNAIKYCMLPILRDNNIIAVSGIMTMSNGCTVEDGRITHLAPPRNLIPLFQELEYLRSFIIGKMGWSAINAMSNVSGGFGLFNRDVCIAAGGYSPDSYAEDMDVVFRMIGYCCENHIDYKIIQIPKNCCHTEGPYNLRLLNRQRTRWGRGLCQTLQWHIKKLGNYHYRRLGMITLPYVFLFEFLAPIIEFTGIIVMIYLYLKSGINWKTAIVIGSAVYMFFVMLSSVVILYTYESGCEYKKLKQYVTLFLAAILEPVCYHPFILIFNLRGYVHYLINKKSGWKSMTRQGYATTAKNKV